MRSVIEYVRTMRCLAVILLVTSSALAVAKPLTLTPFDAGAFTVSMPEGWAVHGDASSGAVLAQQDAKRADAAQLLVVVSKTPASDDQALDAIVGKAATGLKIVQRGALPGGAGKQLIAEGVTGGVKVRLGAIAIGNGGGIVIGLVVAKVDDFDGLGGIGLVANALGSLNANGAAAPAPAPALAPAAQAPPAQVGRDAVMTPQFDSYHSLIIPPPSRALTLADLAGDWTDDSGALTNYYSASTGAHVGYSAVVGKENWLISAKGGLVDTYHGATVSNKAVHAIDETSDASITLSADGVLAMVFKKFPQQTTLYLVRGWFVGPDVTMVKLVGPFYNTIAPEARKPEPNGYSYLRRVFVRNNAK